MMENKTKIDLKNKSVFITGVAGFIGSNLAKRLLSTVEGVKIVGLDNMNNYYDVRLKEARLNELEQFENFSFVKGNLADKSVIEAIFEQYKPEIVVNLGAQAGVRYSITNPDAYVEANLIGFYNILEACRHSYDEGHTPVEHLVYASSSSVYLEDMKIPEIARALDVQGVQTPQVQMAKKKRSRTKNKWQDSTIRSLLKNKRKEVITMPRTKGSKNRPKTNITKDYASQIAEKQESITSLSVDLLLRTGTAGRKAE